MDAKTLVNLGTNFTWWAASLKEGAPAKGNKAGTSSVTHDITSRVSQTPIPGAAWLLGSGILGLLGLKRRKSHSA